ncbi:di-trans,poly-cis-decaprenylcistransferase [Actinomadura sp. KC216]|uniref:polyprenyl diphosphate synthase n=1 Tax=Actinomadura sp. KC216 TaxID=2530370 RepID=UPI00105241BF|nr:polyprenyl diphosphate synthase [Actinomadura sp. KC216]TDB89524.1 di-trans,poly-cis-decaprenylcistransferase [Actinomadura sp. KC216]
MASSPPVRHVACIMDGNGRWARNRGLDRVHGHLASKPAFEAIINTAIAENVQWLTLFAFSTENWSRPAEEVAFLVDVLAPWALEVWVPFLRDSGVRVRALGATNPKISTGIMERIRRAEEATRANDRLNLTVAFDYGGRDDIAQAARSLAAADVPAENITADLLARNLQLPELPDVDLLIRTGGEQRLSNFLLWQCAYAELVFLDVLWPDFRAGHLRDALSLYQQRQRRFGQVPDEADTLADLFGDPRAVADAALTAAGAVGVEVPTSALSLAVPPGAVPLPGLARMLSLPGVVATHLTTGLLSSAYRTTQAAAAHLRHTRGDSAWPGPRP